MGHDAHQSFFPGRADARERGIEIAEIVIAFGWFQGGPILANGDPINVRIIEHFLLGW